MLAVCAATWLQAPGGEPLTARSSAASALVIPGKSAFGPAARVYKRL